MIFLIASVATANVVWAVTGRPVRAPIAALAGFVCGVAWMAVYVKGAL